MYESRAGRLRELSRGATPRIPQPEGIALPLHPLQIAAAEYATLAPRMILGDPPGTGKDLSAIAAFVYRINLARRGSDVGPYSRSR